MTTEGKVCATSTKLQGLAGTCKSIRWLIGRPASPLQLSSTFPIRSYKTTPRSFLAYSFIFTTSIMPNLVVSHTG